MQHTISPALRSVYQVFARNYSAKGTLQAVTGDLPRIAAMGFGWVYLTPVHCTGIRGRKGTLGSPYAVRDYRSVDPSLGTMDDFLALSEEAHRLGMRVMMDIVINHSSPDNVWVQQHPEYYLKNSDGSIGRKVDDWTDVADFDYGCEALRQELVGMLLYWADHGADGFRCDVASLVPLAFWKRARKAVNAGHPEFVWLAESVEPEFVRFMRSRGYECAGDSDLYQAFDVLYNYDIRAWFDRAAGQGDLLGYEQILNYRAAEYPQGFLKLNHLENHDRTRFAAIVPDARARANWLAFSFLYPGMAFVYAGQEAGCTHTPSLFDRDPVDWQGRSAQTEQLIAALNRTREAVLEPAAAAVLEENPQALVFRLSSRDGMYTGVFDVLQHEETIAVPLADGAYEDCITGNKISVREGRVSASLCPLLLEEKKARK
jgi:glycosidase